MSQLAGFSGHYSPGGAPKALRRRWAAQENGRKGGLASGVKRKQLARGKRTPRSRTRAEALALRYPVRQVRRPRFDRIYAAKFPAPERGTALAAWERGRDTCWAHYVARFRRYRCEGQHYRTTKPQCAKALEQAGRPRCAKTVQRLNGRLREMGLLVASHERRGGWRAGRKDLLVVEMRNPSRLACPTAPSERGLPALRPEVAPPLGTEEEQTFERTTATTTSVPPTPSADEAAADAANGNGGADGEESDRIAELEAALAFAELKAERPMLRDAQLPKIRRLRMELRALREGRDAQLYAERPEHSPSLRWRGDRC